MKIHEYQGKEILKKYGVPVPRAIPAFSVDDAIKAAQALGGSVWVVKAQIHAGGRGKGGGVKVAKSMDEVKQYAEQILGMQLVTHQTGPAGQKVRRLLIEEGADIQKEYYLGMVIDRTTQKVCVMASSEGGMNIEEVAEHTPELIHKLFVDPVTGVTDIEGDELAVRMGMPAECVHQTRATIQKLYQAFVETDADLAEINPLITTGDGRVVALDAKMNFDSNALYRHPEIVEMRDLDEEDPAEIEASKYDLAYISLDGNIGCLVNGAGLAMATMDTIKLYGGEPANFLDVGGGASTEKVTEAFKIMLKNPNLKAILVNIFGGIMKCDVIAEGVVSAAKQVHLQVPLVVRMKGTNEDLGKKMLAESGLPIITADTMAQAAERVVAAADGKPIPTGDGLSHFGKPGLVAGAIAGVSGVAASVSDKLSDASESVIDTVKNVAGDVMDLAQDAKHAVSDAAGDAAEVMGDILEGTVDVVKNIAGGAVHLAGDAVRLRDEMLSEQADGAVRLTDDAVENLGDSGKAVVGAVAGAGVIGAAALGNAGEGAGKNDGGLGGFIKRWWWLAALALLALWLFKSCTGGTVEAPKQSNTSIATAQTPAVTAPTVAANIPADLTALFKAKGANIELKDGKWVLSGEVADQASKDDLLAAAKAALATLSVGVGIDDKLMVKGATASAGAQLLKVEFAAGSAMIPASAKVELDTFATGLKKSNAKGEISGHSDNTGDPAANLALSNARAKAVVAYLLKQGVAAGSLSAKGYGSDAAIADNATADGRARNRRVEFMPAK